jgi:hypothetical protein
MVNDEFESAWNERQQPGNGVIEVISRYLPAHTEKNHEAKNVSGRGSNPASTEFNS